MRLRRPFTRSHASVSHKSRSIAGTRRRSTTASVALYLLLVALSPARGVAQPARPGAIAGDSADTLGKRIEALIAHADLSAEIGLSVVEVETGRPLVAIRADTPWNPASNLKLLTAASALLVLGPEFRMQTGLYGRVRHDHTEGGLCLKGHADPTLARVDFTDFAQRLHDRGVRSVDRLIIDGSYFDEAILPPAFEQQPNETAPFRAAVAAVSVNANAYTLRVGPGAEVGTPARVTVEGPGYFDLDNQVTTTTSPTPRVSVNERDLGDKVALTVTGSVPLNGGGLALPRRVSSPLHYAGHVFIDALAVAGIQPPAQVELGTCPSDAPLLARHESQPLAEVLARLGKNSDNFAAEMLVKVLGAEHEHKPGSTAEGVAVVKQTLHGLGLPTENLSMINGSGLFEGNRVTTALISRLLVAMYRNPALRSEFVAHLSVGGADGTLARRLTKLAQPRIVRAKTGTLNDVIALSGYVLGPVPGRVYAFSYLANGIKGKQGQARALIDKVVTELASDLYAGADSGAP